MEVSDQPVSGHLEDRRIGVFVDRDDHARILDAGKVLNRAGNPERDVELGRDYLAGLADLVVVRREAGIDCGASGADGSAERVGQAADETIETFLVLKRPTAADDDPRFG